MDQSLLYRMLEGDEEATALFGNAENCAVIDGRDGPAEIVAAIAAFLPAGYLILGRVTPGSCELQIGGGSTVTVPLSARATQENLLLSISQAMEPAFELRQFRPCDGDGYSIFIAPCAVWSGIERTHPEATEALFLTARRLAAYWSKSYLARLFDKP